MLETLLVGDIGGTNARFGIASQSESGLWTIDHFAKYAGDDYPTLQEAIAEYIKAFDIKPLHMSLAVAGPIENGKATLTNRAWSVSETELNTEFGLLNAGLFNDFAAMARSVPELKATDFDVLKEGVKKPLDPILVAGAGTGFGVAYLLPDGDQWHVISTEGGHIAYVPRTPEELVIRDILARDHGYVSLELVSSGSGLDKVYKAVCERHSVRFKKISPDDIRSKAKSGDTLCLEVCQLRAHAIMGALGDLTLAGGARGGLVLAGGVTERMVSFITAPDALSVFKNRGPRTDYMKDIPISLMANPVAPLIGAAALYKALVLRT